MRVGLLGGADQDQPISANAEVPIADDTAQRGGILRRLFAEAIDVDVVVAAALKLGETHVTHRSLREFSCCPSFDMSDSRLDVATFIR